MTGSRFLIRDNCSVEVSSRTLSISVESEELRVES